MLELVPRPAAEPVLSYARFCEPTGAPKGSDVYVYADESGAIRCACCSLRGDLEDHIALDALRMLVHVAHQMDAGHSVPSRCIKRLESEIE